MSCHVIDEQLLIVREGKRKEMSRTGFPTTAIKDTFVGEPTTELDSTISGIPWGDSFTFRYGVDAITGGVMGAAVKMFTPEKGQKKSVSEHYRFIQSENELNREIEASVSGKYNIQGVNASSSASYLSKIKFSEISTTLIAEYKSQYESYDEVESYELTSEAQRLIDAPAKFREAYGDYFVAGGRRISRFIAIYTCQTSSVESMDEFKTSFGADAPEVFSAEGSSRFMQAAKQHNIDISTDLFLEGIEGVPPSGPWTPEKILEALTWFKEHEEGVYLQAKLRHYSQLDPSYPRTVDVAPSAFVDLRQLYTMLWDIRSRYNSCPKFYQSQLKKEFTDLDAGVVANQAVLATDAKLRLEYIHKADSLQVKLEDVFGRMDFYFKVRRTIGSEPPRDQAIEEGNGQQIWSYGYRTYTKSPAVQISSVDMHYSAEWQFAKRRDHTFEYDSRGQTIIVGWEVVSNWNDGTNGSWTKVIDRILLTDHAAVYVRSLLSRGCDWSVRIYYVDAKDYQFDTMLNANNHQFEEKVEEVDKGYKPQDSPTEYYPPAQGGWKLIIGLFPYVPRPQQFVRRLTRQWQRLYPTIDLEFVPFNSYQDRRPLHGIDVIGLDNIRIRSYAENNLVEVLDLSRFDSQSVFPFALNACQVNNQLYGFPYLMCTHGMFCRENNRALLNARGIEEVEDILGICPNPEVIWPAQGKGLLLSFSGAVTSGCHYINANAIISNQYAIPPVLPASKNDLNRRALSNLNIWTHMAGYSQTKFVDPERERITHFNDGCGAALVGVSELACFLSKGKLNTFRFRSMPYADGAQRLPLFVDSLAINASIPDEKREAAYNFIKMLTSYDMLIECLGTDPEEAGSIPQFLIPSRLDVLRFFARDYLLYSDVLQMLNGANPYVMTFGSNSWSWMTGGMPKEIRGLITGPLSIEDHFQTALVSKDPSAPTNLLDKW